MPIDQFANMDPLFIFLTFHLVLRQKDYFFVANKTIASTSFRELSFFTRRGGAFDCGRAKVF